MTKKYMLNAEDITKILLYDIEVVYEIVKSKLKQENDKV